MKKSTIIMMSLPIIASCAPPNDIREPGLKDKAPINKNGDSARSQTQMPLPRDPQIAVQEEFDAAKSTNTIDAWELFLQRHPNNSLTSVARRRLQELSVARTKSP